MSYVLWLASWYPCKLTPFDGDFIQRHARATALFEKITVIHVKKDEHRIITDDVKENISTSKNLTEIIVYYHSYKTGFNLFDRILSTAKYKKTYRAILKKHIKLFLSI